MACEIGSILNTCSTCKRAFDTQCELIDHKKIHRQAVELPIEEVNAQSTNPALVSTDEIVSTTRLQGFWYCKFCDKLFKTSSGYYNHKVARGQGPRVVPKESREAGTLSELEINPRVSCKYCLATFANYSNLRLHKEGFHSTNRKKMTYYCSLCTDARTAKPLRRYFADEEKLWAHVAKKHEEWYRLQKIGETTDKCSTSEATTQSAWSTIVKTEPVENETFDNAPDVKMEQSDYRQNKNEILGQNERDSPVANVAPRAKKSQVRKMKTCFNCEYCLATFAHKNSLERHQYNFHPKKQRLRMYFCSKCPKYPRDYFNTEKDLLAHAAEKHKESAEKRDVTVKTMKRANWEAEERKSIPSSQWSSALMAIVAKTGSVESEAFANDRGTIEFGDVEMEPSANDQALDSSITNLATITGSDSGSSDINANSDNSHYFCQFLATSLDQLDFETSTRVQADIKQILQMATDGRNWVLINDSDTFPND